MKDHVIELQNLDKPFKKSKFLRDEVSVPGIFSFFTTSKGTNLMQNNEDEIMFHIFPQIIVKDCSIYVDLVSSGRRCNAIDSIYTVCESKEIVLAKSNYDE